MRTMFGAVGFVLGTLVLVAGCSGSADSGDTGSTADEGVASEGLRTGMVEAMRFAHAAGVPCDARLVMAGAIAAAESGLDTGARGPNGPTSGCRYGSVDRGLWQINSCYHSEYSDGCAYDGACNARAMVAISSGGNDWGPWSTYHNGAYRAHYAEAQAALGRACSGGGGPSDRVEGTNGNADPGCFSNTLRQQVPDNTCVESRFDRRWYQCRDGMWANRFSDPEACVSVHPL